MCVPLAPNISEICKESLANAQKIDKSYLCVCHIVPIISEICKGSLANAQKIDLGGAGPENPRGF